jgi:hypothetical protein
MNWLDAVQNPKAIKEIFEVVPSLKDVEVVSFLIDRDGPTVVVHLALNEPPDRLPARKKRIGANAVTLKLQLLGVDELALEGWATENRASVEIKLDSVRRIEVSIDGSTMRFKSRCQWVRIEGVEAYQRA